MKHVTDMFSKFFKRTKKSGNNAVGQQPLSETQNYDSGITDCNTDTMSMANRSELLKPVFSSSSCSQRPMSLGYESDPSGVLGYNIPQPSVQNFAFADQNRRMLAAPPVSRENPRDFAVPPTDRRAQFLLDIDKDLLNKRQQGNGKGRGQQVSRQSAANTIDSLGPGIQTLVS